MSSLVLLKFMLHSYFAHIIWFNYLLQFKQGTWTDVEQLGIKELKGAFRVTASNINLIVASLTTELEMAILQGEFENHEQEEMVEKALTNLSSPAVVEDLWDDIRI